ncbi:MAG: DMT family transporter [Bacillota bacterium]
MNIATNEPKPFSRNKAIFYVAISAALWSSSGLFIKLIDWSPLAIAGVRSAIAAVVMLLIMNRRLRFNCSFPRIGGAVAYACTVILFVLATKLTTAANAILLQYTTPVFTALFGAWLLKEKVSRYDWGIIALVLGGMALFFLDKLTLGGVWGNGAAVLSGITFSFFILFMRMQKSGSPLETVILGNLITALVCLPFALQHPPAAPAWSALVFLGVFQLGLPFLLFSTGIKHLAALDAVLIQVIEPLLNPIWVLLVIGEAPGPWAVVGGAVVLLSVTVRSVHANKKAPFRAPAEL